MIYESLTVVYFLITSILLVVCVVRLQPSTLEKKYYALKRLSIVGIALLFFVGAGEEMSWGQRIFHVATPQAVKEANVQGELTIHNLAFFQGDAATLDFSSLQTIFSLTFTFVIPLLGFVLKRFNWNLDAIFPVLPLPVGILAVMNYGYQKFLRYFFLWFPQLYLHPTMPFGEGLYEIREHGHAYAMMISVLFYLVLKLESRESNQVVRDVEQASGS
jgi:hypothetical protein